MGVVMPSVDRVGRRFPLTLMAPLSTPGPAPVDHLGAERVFEKLEDLALLALEDTTTQAHLRNGLQTIPIPSPPDAPPIRAMGATVVTHVGLVRKINEDAVLGLPEHSIWLVSDGMGGHEAGDYASRLIADSVATIPLGLDPGARMHALREAIQTAHNAIQTEAARRGGGTIGATVAALLMTTGHFVALWAGDSRIYRLRDGDLQMLTIDHSAVAEYVTAGKMTWDEAEQHPQSNAITRAVGVGEDLEIDKIRGETQSGDRFLICSDGLTKYTTHAMLERVLQENALENVGESLMQIAIAGGGADNISIIIVDVQ
ncbi:Protein phosphatase PrpC [Nymphon striatum]|nr:Protein phosphatase PrpC [Nymphon striatum]